MNRVPLLVWFLVPSVILLVVGIWIISKTGSGMSQSNDFSDTPEAVSEQVEGVAEFKIVSRTHIATGTSATDYISNPPTSGQHWDQPVKTGIFDKALPDEQLVHNLEHGHIWISYIPANSGQEATGDADIVFGISEEELNKLKEIVEKDDWKVIMAPRDKNDSKIALVAWGRFLKMDEPDYDKIRDFIKIYRNRGPEKTPD